MNAREEDLNVGTRLIRMGKGDAMITEGNIYTVKDFSSSTVVLEELPDSSYSREYFDVYHPVTVDEYLAEALKEAEESLKEAMDEREEYETKMLLADTKVELMTNILTVIKEML